MERLRGRSLEKEKAEVYEEKEEEEEAIYTVVVGLDNLTIETGGMEEEAADSLKATIGMEVEENRASEVEVGCDRTQRDLGALEFLTQDAEPSRTTLVDAWNGFNDLSRLAMLWNVRHRWPAGASFAFNCYRHQSQFLLHQPWESPVTILNR